MSPEKLLLVIFVAAVATQLSLATFAIPFLKPKNEFIAINKLLASKVNRSKDLAENIHAAKDCLERKGLTKSDQLTALKQFIQLERIQNDPNFRCTKESAELLRSIAFAVGYKLGEEGILNHIAVLIDKFAILHSKLCKETYLAKLGSIIQRHDLDHVLQWVIELHRSMQKALEIYPQFIPILPELRKLEMKIRFMNDDDFALALAAARINNPDILPKKIKGGVAYDRKAHVAFVGFFHGQCKTIIKLIEPVVELILFDAKSSHQFNDYMNNFRFAQSLNASSLCRGFLGHNPADVVEAMLDRPVDSPNGATTLWSQKFDAVETFSVSH